MRTIRARSIGMLALTALLGCSDDPTGVSQATCPAATTMVRVTTTVTASAVTFNWEPACGVALLLVEQDASDRWSIMSPEADWKMPDRANRILPPVTYGLARGDTQASGGAPLVAGETYDVVLWRIVTPALAATCEFNFENACLLAVHEFTR